MSKLISFLAAVVVAFPGASLAGGRLPSPQIDLSNAVNVPVNRAIGNLPVANLAAGAYASLNTYWRGDGAWASFPAYAVLAGVAAPVSNNVALGLLPSTYATSVLRLGYAAIGDSPSVLYTPSATACLLNSGAGDGGSQVPSSDGKCWIASLPGPVDVRIFGAKCDGSTDDTAAFAAAAASKGAGGTLLMPPAVCYVGASAALNLAGITLKGDDAAFGDTPTFETASYTLLLSSLHSIVVGNNTKIEGVRITRYGLTTPTTMRAALIQVSLFAGTAIVANNAIDWELDHVTIIGFNRAIVNNAAGRYRFTYLSVDSNSGVQDNFCSDSCFANNIEFWPFIASPAHISPQWQSANISNIVASGGKWAITLASAPGVPFVTGDNISVSGVVGASGANGYGPITVTDSTHFTLSASNTAPSVSGSTTNGSTYLELSSLANVAAGEAVSGTGIPTGTTVAYIVPWMNSVILSSAATATGSSTYVFSSGAYAAGGVAHLDATSRSGIAYEIVGTGSSWISGMIEYGYQTALHVGGNAYGSRCFQCWFDGDPGDINSNTYGLYVDGNAVDTLLDGLFVSSKSVALLNANSSNNNVVTVQGGTLGATGVAAGVAGSAVQSLGGRLILSGITFRDSCTYPANPYFFIGNVSNLVSLAHSAASPCFPAAPTYQAASYCNRFSLDGVTGPCAWTPTLYGQTTVGAPSYAADAGYFTISSNGVVNLMGRIVLTSLGGVAGNTRIGWLPVLPGADTSGSAGACYISRWQNMPLTTNYTTPNADLPAAVNYIELLQNGPGLGLIGLDASNLRNNSEIQFSCQYRQ